MKQLADAVTALDGAASEVSGKATSANWERGERSPTPEKVRRVTEAMGLGVDEREAMVGMWRAAGSAAALAPRPYWEHNYHADGGPVWLWLWHPADQPVSMAAGWGPFGMSVEMPATAAGSMPVNRGQDDWLCV